MTLANCRYYLGPWEVETNPSNYWRSPIGTVGNVDLGTIPDLVNPSSPRALGFFASSVQLSDDYTFLGEGDCREITTTALMRSAWESATGYLPQGNNLVDLLWDHLTNGADPDGQQTCKPLMPTVSGDLELHLSGHSKVKSERFTWGHAHTNRIRDIIRRDLKVQILYGRAEKAELEALATAISPLTWQQANNSTNPVIVANRPLLRWLRERGFTIAQAVERLGIRANRTERQYRKILDWTLEKHRLDKAGWQDLCPQDMIGELEPPEPHETTLNETWNTADSTTLGPVYTWTEWAAGIENFDSFEVKSNQLACDGNATADQAARANSDLSGADHYSQLNATALASGTTNCWIGATARFSSSAHTCYVATVLQFNDTIALYKIVAGTMTALGSPVSITVSLPAVVKCEINGSTLKSFWAGSERESITDTAISGGVRCGVQGFNAAVDLTSVTGDDWEAADLGGGGGDISGTAALAFGAGSSALTGAGALAGPAAIAFGAGASTLVGAGAISGASAVVFGHGSSTLTGTGTLTGASALVFGHGSSTLTGGGALTGSSAVVLSATGTVLGSGAMAGSSILTFGAVASTVGTGSLSGSTTVSFTVSGTIGVPGDMNGTAAMVFTVSGTATNFIAPSIIVCTATFSHVRTTPLKFEYVHHVSLEFEHVRQDEIKL